MKCFLVVGYGSIGKRHVNILKLLYPDILIVIVSKHKGNEKAMHNGGNDVEQFVETLDEALNFKPLFAIIANPSSLHLNVSTVLAREGVHLLIEKPLSNGLSGIDELLKVCRSRKLCLHIGYNLRFLPTLQYFRSQLHDGRIGRILSVRCEVGQALPLWRPNQDYKDTVSAQKKLGGGVLLELSHEIDYLRWIFGEIVEVTALVHKQSSLEIDVEDTAMLLLKSMYDQNGDEILISLNMDFTRYDATRKCTVIGEKGTLSWDGIAGIVTAFDNEKAEWKQLFIDNPDRDLTYRLEIQHFVNSIAHPVPAGLHASGEDAKKVLEIVETAKKSAVQRKTITIKSGTQNE
jgi:predicted dehydrogenase